MERGHGWLKGPATATMNWRKCESPTSTNLSRLAQAQLSGYSSSTFSEDQILGKESVCGYGTTSPTTTAHSMEVADRDARSHFEKQLVGSLQRELADATAIVQRLKAAKDVAQAGLTEGMVYVRKMEAVHVKVLQSKEEELELLRREWEERVKRLLVDKARVEERLATLEDVIRKLLGEYDEVEHLRGERVSLQEELGQVKAELEQCQKEGGLLKDELQQLQGGLDSVRERQQQLVAEKDAAQNELDATKANSKSLRKHLESYEERRRQLEGDKESIRRELLSVKADMERQQQLEAAREAITKELEVVKVDVRQRQKEVESYEERLQQLAAEKEAVLEELASVKAAADKQQQEYKKLQQQLVAEKKLLLLKAIDENRRAELAEYKEGCKGATPEEPAKRTGYSWRLRAEREALQEELVKLKAEHQKELEHREATRVKDEAARELEKACQERDESEKQKEKLLTEEVNVLQKGLAHILTLIAKKNGPAVALGVMNSAFQMEKKPEALSKFLQIFGAAIERSPVVEERQVNNERSEKESALKVEQQQGQEVLLNDA